MSLSSLNSIGQTVFELESGNKNVDGQKTDKRTDGITPISNLAMMVIYVPVKLEFDWTNRFRVTVRKRKCGRTDRQTELHQFRKEPSYDGDLASCQV